MKSKLNVVAYLALLTALLCASGLEAQVCSTLTTVGRYSVVCDGYLTPAANAPLTPAKILGIVTANDDGVFNGSATVSLGGTIVPQTVTGPATINKDCSGSITYAQTLGGQAGPPLDITFVVSQEGNRIDGLATDTGAVLSCVLRRLSNAEPASISGLTTANRSWATAQRSSGIAARSDPVTPTTGAFAGRR